jgi:16S rRNA (cytosine1402-N4)-methyltransferase
MLPSHDKNSGEKGGNVDDPLRFATGYHAPVLWKTVVENLVTDPDGTYVDGTLGGGGHAAALLSALGPHGCVVGIDQDADALQAAGSRLQTDVEAGRLKLVRGNFRHVRSLLQDLGIDQVQGLLLDLGVSSHQIDRPERGFSYIGEGALDMRMDTRTGITAGEIINEWPDSELWRILKVYGEEPRASAITRVIVENRPFATTTEVADTIRGVIPGRDAVKTLSRVFQAIRIVVNGELEALEEVLEAAVEIIRPGGRIAVISYHSLEDRRVKDFLRYGNFKGEPVRDLYGNLQTPWRLVHRKPITASEREVAANPRARSARLRVAERTSDTENEP